MTNNNKNTAILYAGARGAEVEKTGHNGGPMKVNQLIVKDVTDHRRRRTIVRTHTHTRTATKPPAPTLDTLAVYRTRAPSSDRKFYSSPRPTTVRAPAAVSIRTHRESWNVASERFKQNCITV